MSNPKYQSVSVPDETLTYEEWRAQLRVSTLYHASSIIERVNRDEVEMYSKDFQTTYFEQTQRRSLLSKFIHRFSKTGTAEPQILLGNETH
jgi:hypothetical protein